MKPILLVSIALGIAAAATPASAQTDRPWSLEIRPGATIATESYAGTDLKTGLGVEGSIGYRLAGGLSVFAGWDWQHRRAESVLFARGRDVEDTGYVYGLRFVAPVAAAAKPFLRVAGLWNHVEIEDDDGALVADSEHTWGLEIGGGLDLSLAGPWSLSPGVRYRRFEPTVSSGGMESKATLSYLTFDLGISWKF